MYMIFCIKLKIFLIYAKKEILKYEMTCFILLWKVCK